MKFSTMAATAALIMGTTEVKAGPRMVGIGSNYGNRAATLIASNGDVSGSSYSELSADAFNALSVEELRENYDVLIFSWATPADLNAHWGDRLLPYLQLGGGILFEDPANLADLSPAVMGVEYNDYGPYYSIIHNEPGLTDGITGTFVNSHMKFDSWSSDFTEFIHFDNGSASFATGLFGSFESSDAITCGRIVLAGPDSHYHAYPLGDDSAAANHYNLLVNTVNWVTSCVPSNLARPTAICNDIVVQAGPECQGATVTIDDINNGSFDLDDGGPLASSSLSLSLTGPFGVGTTNVTLTVTDSHGAIDECTATVTVTNTPPVASCKSVEVVLAGPAGQDTSVTAATINDGSSDEEDDDDLSFSLSPSGPFDVGTTDVTLTVTDTCGATDECTATVTVTINTPPIASCKSVEVSAGPACQDTSVTAADINDGSSDDQDDDDLLSFSLSPSGPFDIGTTDVTLTVTDSHGAIDECTATVTVVDDEAPVVDCGDIGVIAPCQVPLDIPFGAQPKTNGCPVTTTTVSHGSCSFCNGANKIKHRDCVVSVLGDTATITEAGGVQSHISFDVTVTNDNDGLTSTRTCTICTQNPSVDFEPGCSTQGSVGGPSTGGFVCGAGFPNSILTCGGSGGGRSLLRGGGVHGGDYGDVVKN